MQGSCVCPLWQHDAPPVGSVLRRRRDHILPRPGGAPHTRWMRHSACRPAVRCAGGERRRAAAGSVLGLALRHLQLLLEGVQVLPQLVYLLLLHGRHAPPLANSAPSSPPLGRNVRRGRCQCTERCGVESAPHGGMSSPSPRARPVAMRLRVGSPSRHNNNAHHVARPQSAEAAGGADAENLPTRSPRTRFYTSHRCVVVACRPCLPGGSEKPGRRRRRATSTA